MAVTATDLLQKAQQIIDKQATLGISISTSAVQKAEYDAAHAQALADSVEYSQAFDDFVNASHDFNKDTPEIP